MQKTKIGVVIHTSLRDELFTAADIQRLNRLGEVVWTDKSDKLTVEEACELLADCTIGIGSWGTPSPCQQIMDAAPKLRMWEHVAGTTKKFFGPHLDGRDFTVVSCKGAIADCVAEMTVGEIICGLRRIPDNALANKTKSKPKPANLKVLCTSSVGIIAASEVGRRVINLLKPFGCSVALFDPFVTEEKAKAMGVTLYSDLTKMCADCDVITLHTPNIPETQKMIGAEQFKAMKDDAIFVNTSRGSCADETALVAELQKGRLFAFLDVTDPEPAALDSPLRSLPNVIITSHIAGPKATNLGRQCVDDVEAFLSGGTPQCVVTADMLAYTA